MKPRRQTPLVLMLVAVALVAGVAAESVSHPTSAVVASASPCGGNQPRPAQPPWPQCRWSTPSGAAQEVHVSYNPSGQPGYLDTSRVMARITAALASWSNIRSPNGEGIRYVFDGITQESVSAAHGCPTNRPSTNIIAWTSFITDGTAATCPFGADTDPTNLTMNGFIIFLKDTPSCLLGTCQWWDQDSTRWMGTRYDLQTVVLHESGHGAGLFHTPDRNAVMWSTCCWPGAKRTLTADDTAALSYHYQRIVMAQPSCSAGSAA